MNGNAMNAAGADAELTADTVDGMTQVDPELLAEFRRAMTEDVIPDIIEAVEERRMKAAESRHWQLKC